MSPHKDGTPWLPLNGNPVGDWLLERVPMCLRGLPWIRRGYWWQEDIDAIRKEAKELADALRMEAPDQ